MFSPANVTKQTIHFLNADISQIPELQVLSHSGQISLNQPQKKTINVVLCVYMCPHNLQFDGLAIQLDGANLKVHSNGADVALCVGVILQKEEGQHDSGQQQNQLKTVIQSNRSEKHLTVRRYYLQQNAVEDKTFLHQSPQ